MSEELSKDEEIERLRQALETIQALSCTTHLIQGYMFSDADPRKIARQALDPMERKG